MYSRPPSSPTIVGSAVETIVWSSEASSMTSISPLTTSRIERRSAGRSIGGAAALIPTGLPRGICRQCSAPDGRPRPALLVVDAVPRRAQRLDRLGEALRAHEDMVGVV